MIAGVCQSVCLSRAFTRLRCAKAAELIGILLGVKIPGVAIPHGAGEGRAFAELFRPLVIAGGWQLCRDSVKPQRRREKPLSVVRGYIYLLSEAQTVQFVRSRRVDAESGSH